jgi:hypothetical protein
MLPNSGGISETRIYYVVTFLFPPLIIHPLQINSIMKKHLLMYAFIIATFTLQAQGYEEGVIIKGTKKINEKLTPQQVIDSLHQHFPNAKSVKYYKTPADVVARGWTVSEEDNLDAGDDVDYYTISFTNDNLQYYGLYNKDGKLLVSKVKETMTHLPEPIVSSLKALSTQYPGYKVVSRTYYKRVNYSKSEEYYEVVASNGNKKQNKTLFYTPDGTLTKVKG